MIENGFKMLLAAHIRQQMAFHDAIASALHRSNAENLSLAEQYAKSIARLKGLASAMELPPPYNVENWLAGLRTICDGEPKEVLKEAEQALRLVQLAIDDAMDYRRDHPAEVSDVPQDVTADMLVDLGGEGGGA